MKPASRAAFTSSVRSLPQLPVITVSESEIRAAVRELAYRAHLVAEPSGAVALAAYRQGATPPGRTVMILSGGNIEPPMLQAILAG